MKQIVNEESFKFKSEREQLFTLRTVDSFTIIVNDEIVAPKRSTDRYAQIALSKDDDVEVYTEKRSNYRLKPMADRYEKNNGVSKVEIIPEGEMNMYDRLRNEMMGMISQYAEEKGYENYEESDDFELEDEDEPLINTPYEYKAMIEEQPIQEQIKENKTENKTENKEKTLQETTEKQEDTATEMSV